MQNGQMRAKVLPIMSYDISCLLVSIAGITNFLRQLLQVTILCWVMSKKCKHLELYTLNLEGVIKGIWTSA